MAIDWRLISSDAVFGTMTWNGYTGSLSIWQIEVKVSGCGHDIVRLARKEYLPQGFTRVERVSYPYCIPDLETAKLLAEHLESGGTLSAV